MSPTPFARAAAVFATLALTTPARAQQPSPIPLPLPVPQSKPENKAPDARVTRVERGPVHEGFAEPGAAVRGKGLTAPKAPPAPVNEIPPLPKPDGAVEWVPGYWQWDTDRSDFIWVCGCYRVAPLARTWQPGRWKEVNKVWTYFPGYWRPADAKTVLAGLPEPPASKDSGSVTPNANPEAMWVPGAWEYKNGKFEWQAGYWPPGRGNLIWQQGQYVATEIGFSFVPGYWDSPLEERGVLFAPVYFSTGLRATRGWAYRPEYTVPFGSGAKWGQGGAFDTLSIGPNFNNYYVGGPARATVGAPVNRGPRWGPHFTSTDPTSGDSTVDFRPWDAVAPGYTNPLWQHYARLNRADAVSAKGDSDTRVPRKGTNPLAFVEVGPGCAHSSSCGFGGYSRSTVGYQRVSRYGSVTTGFVQYRGGAPGHFGGWHR